MTSSARERFEAETALLRDRLIEAVRRRRLATLDDGLSTLEEVARLILDRSASIDRVMGERRRTPPIRDRFFGQPRADRLGPVGESLWPVIEQAILVRDRTVLSRTLQSVGVLARLAQDRSDVASFDDVAVLYVRAAYRILETAEDGVSDPALADVARRTASRVAALSHPAIAVAEQASLRLIEVAVQRSLEVAKLYLEHGDAEGFKRWAVEFRRALPHLGHGEEVAAHQRHAAVVGLVGNLALRAWVLALWKEEWRDFASADADRLYEAALDQRPPGGVWQAVVEVGDGRLTDRLGLHWWEGMARPDTGRAYMVVFDNYLYDAAALDLLRPSSRTDLPRVEDAVAQSLEELEAWGEQARRLLESLSRLDQYDELSGPRPRQARVRERLEAIEVALEERRTEHLIGLPLDAAEIHLFDTAAREGATSSEWSLASLIPACIGDAGSAPGTAESPEAPAAFGVDRLVPKEYFVDTQETRVHAEADALGQDFGRAVVRGETGLIAGEARQACQEVASTKDDLPEALRAAAEVLSGATRPAVFVFGDHRVWRIVVGKYPPEEGEPWFGDHYRRDRTEFAFFPGAELDGVLLADLDGFICYDRLPPTAKSGGGGGASVAVSVEPITESVARDMSVRQGLAEREQEEEVRRLQKFVRARVLITPRVRILDGSRGRWVAILERDT